jgi:hypothetical protein
MAPLDMLSLDPPDHDAGPRACEAVVLATESLSPTALFWREPSVHDFEQGSRRNEELKVYLESVGGRMVLDPSSRAVSWEVTGALPRTSCEGSQ